VTAGRLAAVAAVLLVLAAVLGAPLAAVLLAAAACAALAALRFALPRVRRPAWTRRRARAPRPAPPAELAGTLRAFRVAALWGISALIITAAGAAFAESYRGLWLWAEHHSLAGFWAAAFPLQVDLFVAVGELVLFVAMTDRWNWRDRAGAWAVALLGLAASVAGNVGHVAAHDLQSRGTAAVPPLAAFAALWLGLGVVKRVVRQHAAGIPRGAAAGDEAAQAAAAAAPAAGGLAGTLAELADAVRALGRGPDAVSSPDAGSAQSALLAELLGAVRGLGQQISDAVSSPVPVGAEHAALIAYRATVAAGNPYSMNALQARFGLTRTQVTRIRQVIANDAGDSAPELTAVNGSHLE
jgi:hypothetical protein